MNGENWAIHICDFFDILQRYTRKNHIHTYVKLFYDLKSAQY